MRTRDLIKLMAAETGIPDYSNPKFTYWKDSKWQLHRDFGPAVTHADGTQEWCRDGKRHREDGPAVVRADGTQEWWRNGKRHREDGPAYVGASGVLEWWRDGFLHRDGGPAVIGADGAEEWWIGGRPVMPFRWKKATR